MVLYPGFSPQPSFPMVLNAVISIFTLVGIIFVPIGVAALLASHDVVEISWIRNCMRTIKHDGQQDWIHTKSKYYQSLHSGTEGKMQIFLNLFICSQNFC
ncbi:hypothetical protein KSP39_PZI003961 [Platanthera zijinensis]|uniref:Uncharacterized protein n=1 Tax=Platanthera zijinensis TaxID=2320716 RepID=A0AAP0BX50_9ASPA